LTPKPIIIEPLDLGTFELSVFGLMASIEKTIMGLFRVVLSLHRQTIVAIETFSPFS
jgi:hypothetical protein